MVDYRSVIITGSTSGIGLAIAEAFAREGYRLMINGVGDVDGEGLCADLRDKGAKEVIFSGADMRDVGAIESMVSQALKAFGGLGVLVNNAGIQHVSAIEDFPPDKWDDIVAINLSSVFHCSRLLSGIMRSQGFGRIINIASAHGLVASPHKAAYVAAKHGVIGLTKVMALELAEAGVTCNAICPGFVDTPLVRRQIDDLAAAHGIDKEAALRDIILGGQPTKRLVSAAGVAELALFLCGDAAKDITGAALSMDGGWTAR